MTQTFVPDTENISSENKRDWEELVSSGLHARESKDKSQWILGDLAMEVETYYGDDSLGKFSTDVGVPKETIKRYRSVSRAYQPEDRLYQLSYTHHMVATSLEEQDRMAILNEALEGQWSVEALIIEIKKRKGEWKKNLMVVSGSFSLAQIEEIQKWFQTIQEMSPQNLNQSSYEVKDKFDKLWTNVKKKLADSKEQEVENVQESK